MEIFGMEKLSLVDYDGKVACTLFTGACNFKCGFCHNSSLVTDFNKIKPLDIQDVFSYLEKRKGILEGVCVSGGEPTLNYDLPEFCKKIKDLGYFVKLDTNGTNPEMIENLYKNGLIDYVAMDIKNDKDHYSSIIGVKDYNTEKVEKSVRFLMTSGIDYEFRTTLIKEYHSEENIRLIAEWIKGAKKYFLQKFKDVGSCILGGLNEVEESTAKRFIDILLPYIPSVFLRGY